MRKKIAMRWRREALRRGAVITSEKWVFNKQELREKGLQKNDNGYAVKVKYKSFVYNVADDDMLKAYKLLIWCMDVADEDDKNLLGGICRTNTGESSWIRG